MTREKGWDEMRRGQMRWHEVRRNQMIWDMIWDKMSCGMWSARVKREVQGVKSAVWSVKKMFAWCCIATWSHAGHVLGRQQRNKLAQSKHARRTARARSIDEKGLIIKSKATSAPPRAGTTGAWIYPNIHKNIPISSDNIGYHGILLVPDSDLKLSMLGIITLYHNIISWYPMGSSHGISRAYHSSMLTWCSWGYKWIQLWWQPSLHPIVIIIIGFFKASITPLFSF